MKPPGEKSIFIKSLDDGRVVIQGYAAVWGSPDDRDLEGEYFTKDTDFWLDKWPGPRPVLYEHGMHPTVKTTVLGKAIKFEADDYGLSVEAELDRHSEYVETILDLADHGVLGWSSGAVSHLVRVESGYIKSWPIAEMTLTVQPAEPRTLGAQALAKLYKSAGLDVPEALVSVGEDDGGLVQGIATAMSLVALLHTDKE